MKTVFVLAAASIALLGACSPEPAASPEGESATPAALDTSGPNGGPEPQFYSADGLIGRWVGGDGAYLEIAPTGDGNYNLELQTDPGSKATYLGIPGAEGITFTRAGESFTLQDTDGDATGVPSLAGKRDCLTVRAGEGYCRS